MEFRIGSFAASKAGHDQGRCYVIVGEEGDFVYLCDGRIKKLEAPKRKRKKHVQIINRAVNDGLCEKLAGASSKATDTEIKYEMKQYEMEQYETKQSMKSGNMERQI